MRPLVPLIAASSVSWARTCSGSSDRLSFVPEKPTTCTHENVSCEEDDVLTPRGTIWKCSSRRALLIGGMHC